MKQVVLNIFTITKLAECKQFQLVIIKGPEKYKLKYDDLDILIIVKI